MTTLQIAGARMHSESAGSGEPVLLLHGGFCSLESLQAQFDALARDHEVFAYERPGHGRSPDVDGEYGYARSLIEAVAYPDAHDLESVHVVGYSDGAILALLLAMDHPERVRSVVAISANLDPSAFTDSAAGLPVLAPLPSPAGAADEPDAEREAYARFSPDGPAHADIVLAKLMRLWTTEPDIAPGDLARIGAPTLIMSADRDTIRPDHSLLIASSIPGAQLCIVPGTTHALVAERPALLTVLIGDFLDEVTASRA